jgi:maltooligosyltrehalose trehalohydrolase
VRLSLWAPAARSADVVLEDGERLAMSAGDAGMWHCDHEGLGPGTRYRLSVDGGEPRPDPRSRFQPDGVDGPSQIDDPTAFAWTDAGFTVPPLRDSIIYELHTGTFSAEGTFDSAIAHLDALVDLGVTTIEVMPVAEFAGRRGWGYDGVDLFAPHHAYGGPDRLRRLVDAAHARGLAVFLDVVYNHLGPAGNHLSAFGPYFSDAHHTPWGQGINVDGPDSRGVRDFIIANARHWRRDFHVDGLRLDATHAILDDSPVHILEELAASVEGLTLVIEDERNDARTITPRGRGGYGIDAQWADELHHAIHVALTGERQGYYEPFTGIDDIVTLLSTPPLGIADGGRHVVCSQNHDQVGNRARGERLEHLVGPAAARIAALLVLTSPYVPLLFQGEEWAASSPFQYFTDHDAELGPLVTEGRRHEFAAFGWKPEDVPDPQDPATFERSKLRWEERAQPEHAEMLDWYRALIALRRATPDLGCGDPTQSTVTRHGDAISIVRGGHLIAVNLGAGETTIPSPWPGAILEPVIGGPGSGIDPLSLAAGSATIWRRAEGG